jgi:hypothetical protein
MCNLAFGRNLCEFSRAGLNPAMLSISTICQETERIVVVARIVIWRLLALLRRGVV